MTGLSILYISWDGVADHIGQSQIVPYLLALSKKGHRITVLTAEKAYKKEVIDDCGRLFKEYNIEWHYVWYHNKPAFVSAVWVLFRMRRLAMHLVESKKVAAVHCRSYLPALMGLYLKQKRGVKFIFDMRDFWIDARKEAHILKTETHRIHQAIYSYFKRKEADFLEQADSIVSLTEAGKQTILKWAKEGSLNVSAPISVIPCCADFDHFDPARISPEHKSEVRRNLGLQADDFVLSYLGSLGPVYLTDEMMDFFKVLLEKRPNAKFLVIANNDHGIARDAAVRKGIDLARLVLARGSREEIPCLIAQSNLAVFFIMSSFSKQACSPTKLAEFLAMNIPVISNTGVGDLDEILEVGINGSAIVARFSRDEYSRVLDRILERTGSGQLAIRNNSMKFSLASGVEAYNEVYRKLHGK